MTEGGGVRERRKTRGLTWPAACAAVALAAGLYFAGAASNPPGFYIDESSVAYNAHLVAETCRDEHGELLPLFFRAFGEYKNPVYVYLLAAVFKVTGPGVAAARYLSAALGVAAGLLLGLLAARVSGRWGAGAAVALSALLTPWLFEGSRLVFEAAAFPAAVALLLLAVERASRRAEWGWGEAARVAAALALVTYTYTVGRALGPMLGAGLALFLTRARWPGLLKTWALYALALVPLAVFSWRHPGALTARFGLLTYVTPEAGVFGTAAEFARHYLLNVNPWRMLLAGEENVRDHVPGAGALLWATAALAVAGLVILWRAGRRGAWWRFVVYGLLASAVPASLTSTEFPQLRLLAFPVFLHALTIPAWSRLLSDDDEERRETAEPSGARHQAATSEASAGGAKSRPRPLKLVAAVLVFLVVAQGLHFQWLFRRDPASRGYVFDDRFARKVLDPTLAYGRAPVYLADAPGRSGYIQALWHGAVRGADPSL
ncbi:MAG TPA: glycosyltransferase family 39 protein, partial [Pyrinomonadaceae bacterium]|nr:glycosyltransferase family 39 protein [Pyrinomonadaceae bacterium]